MFIRDYKRIIYILLHKTRLFRKLWAIQKRNILKYRSIQCSILAVSSNRIDKLIDRADLFVVLSKMSLKELYNCTLSVKIVKTVLIPLFFFQVPILNLKSLRKLIFRVYLSKNSLMLKDTYNCSTDLILTSRSEVLISFAF